MLQQNAFIFKQLFFGGKKKINQTKNNKQFGRYLETEENESFN